MRGEVRECEYCRGRRSPLPRSPSWLLLHSFSSDYCPLLALSSQRFLSSTRSEAVSVGKGRHLPMEPVINPSSEISELQPDPVPFARSYQLDALEMAIRQNTILFLETGSGKTIIAIMLLRNFAHLIRKPSPYIAVFLVPTVVLVTQQGEAIRKHTDLKIGKYWGEMGVDYWDATM